MKAKWQRNRTILKSEIRRPKPEHPLVSEALCLSLSIQLAKAIGFGFRPSDFFRPSDLGFRSLDSGGSWLGFPELRVGLELLPEFGGKGSLAVDWLG